MAYPGEHIPAAIGDWILGDELGHGNFGVVVKATRGGSADPYACKVLSKANLQDAGQLQRFEREVTATTQLKHPNLVALHDFLSDEDHYYLVMDYCPGGELFDYISRNGQLAEPFAALLFGQVAAGIAHCHSCGVAHRDIKLENILFTKFPRVKVADFGLCGFFTDGKLFNTFCGTACYAAPECLKRQTYDGRLSDVWSLGVLLFSMLTGDFLWDPTNIGAMMNAIEGSFS
jgi:serine/threonine protein kinase